MKNIHRLGWIALLLSLWACAMTTEPPPTTTPEPPTVTLAPSRTPLGATAIATSIVPTATPFCENAPATRLIVHERARVTENGRQLNLRGSPSTSATIIRKLDPGAIFEVIGGPRCAEGYTWFQIRFETSEGWIAEGDDKEYYVEPYQTG